MQLISKGMYEAIYRPKKDVLIEPFDSSLFDASCYYFRLGAIADGSSLTPMTEPKKLPKHKTLHVFSLETFTLSSRAFALLGPCTELLIKGLWLCNSPTIDPGFSGSLELLIENHTDETMVLEPAMKIGKVVFFNVSDSLIDFHDYMQQEKQKAAWVDRKHAGEKILEAYHSIEKIIEAEAPKKILNRPDK